MNLEVQNKRVLFAATSLTPGSGGIQRVGRMTANVLQEILIPPHELQILTLYDNGQRNDFRNRSKHAGGSRLKFLFHALKTRCTHLMTDACNLGQIHVLPGLSRKPYLTFLHGIEIWEDARPRWVHSAQQATTSVFVSEYSRTRASEIHGPFPNSVVCSLATESDEAPHVSNKTRRMPNVLIVGRLFEERYKGHSELIDAWPAVVDKVPDAILRIVGTGPGASELQKMAGRSRAAENIVFEGFVSEERLEELYATASLFAMPSRGEGFGLVYIEAMRHHLPVIASTHDAGHEIVQEGLTGYCVNLDEQYALAERIIAILRDDSLQRRLGEAGFQRWHSLYRFSSFRDRITPILKKFLGMT